MITHFLFHLIYYLSLSSFFPSPLTSHFLCLTFFSFSSSTPLYLSYSKHNQTLGRTSSSLIDSPADKKCLHQFFACITVTVFILQSSSKKKIIWIETESVLIQSQTKAAPGGSFFSCSPIVEWQPSFQWLLLFTQPMCLKLILHSQTAFSSSSLKTRRTSRLLTFDSSGGEF